MNNPRPSSASILILAVLAAFVLRPALAELSADQVMAKNEAVSRLRNLRTEATLISGGRGSEKSKAFSFWRKLSVDGVHYSTLTRFHAPAEIRDEGVLILENRSGVNDVLLYLPAYKKIRRVEAQQQSGSFMGTVFSYSDIAAPHVEDYTYRDLRTEPCPTPDAAAIRCRVIEGRPAHDRVRERTGYGKCEFWVRTDNFMVVQAAYEDLGGKPYKRMTARDLREVEPREGKWMAFDVRVERLDSHEWTSLKFGEVTVNQPMSDAIFTQQNLAAVR